MGVLDVVYSSTPFSWILFLRGLQQEDGMDSMNRAVFSVDILGLLCCSSRDSMDFNNLVYQKLTLQLEFHQWIHQLYWEFYYNRDFQRKSARTAFMIQNFQRKYIFL